MYFSQLQKRKNKKPKFMINKNVSLLFMGIAAITITCSCGASKKFSTKLYSKAEKEAPYDAVIVPGTPYLDSSSLGTIFAARILWAKYLFEKGITKNIIFSGAAVASPYYEGAAMKTIADSLGLPAEHTFAETKAEHSTENAYYGMKMAKTMGFRKIALATDPFQTKMLLSFLKKRCGNMAAIPTVFAIIDPKKERKFSLPKINPASAYVPNFVPLAERENFFERFKGTRGKHIQFEE
jgi:uncharacterized SAM-binding protein YcdF (DUF218 family)